MGGTNLNKEHKGFWLVVELLLQDSGGLLKVSLGGYMKGSAKRTLTSRLQDNSRSRIICNCCRNRCWSMMEAKNVNNFPMGGFRGSQLPKVSRRDSGYRHKDWAVCLRQTAQRGYHKAIWTGRKKKKERERWKKKEGGGEERKEKRRAEEKKKTRGVGWCLIEFSAGTIVNTQGFGQRFHDFMWNII